MNELAYVGEILDYNGADYEVREILQDNALNVPDGLALVQAINLDTYETAYLILSLGMVEHLADTEEEAREVLESYSYDIDDLLDEDLEGFVWDRDDDYYLPTDAVYSTFDKNADKIDNLYEKKVRRTANKKESRNTRVKASRRWEDFDRYDKVIDEYVPDRGEGQTMATQAVTAVNKLVYMWFVNGDVYDNRYRLDGWANDVSSYANWLFENVKGTGATLERIKRIYSEGEYEDILYALATIVLRKNFLERLDSQPKVGTIYDCDGPFEFGDKADENDEDGDVWASKKETPLITASEAGKRLIKDGISKDKEQVAENRKTVIEPLKAYISGKPRASRRNILREVQADIQRKRPKE